MLMQNNTSMLIVDAGIGEFEWKKQVLEWKYQGNMYNTPRKPYLAIYFSSIHRWFVPPLAEWLPG